MLDKNVDSKISKDEIGLNQVNTYSHNEDSTQVLDLTKKPCFSTQVRNANARKNLLNFKLANRSMHIGAVDYLDVEELKESMELKNITKCAVNSQQAYIYNADHDNEMDQGDQLRNYMNSSSLGKIVLRHNHDSMKRNTINYDYGKLYKSNPSQLEDTNKAHGDAVKQKSSESKYLMSTRKYKHTRENIHNRRTKIKEHKYKRENADQIDYAYFESDEEDEDIQFNINRTVKVDKIEKIQVVAQGKLYILLFFLAPTAVGKKY